MKTIKLEEFEIDLIKELVFTQIERIDSGSVTYGTEEDNMEYKQDYQNILNKL